MAGNAGTTCIGLVMAAWTFWVVLDVRVEAVCDRSLGPSGSIHCFSDGRYLETQWSTCLSNQYIQLKSQGRHGCLDRTTLFCYYQCMLELYDIDSGNVTSDCYYQCMLELYDVDSGNVTSDCYYQCMLELYDVDSGNVTSDCYYQCMLELYDVDSGNVTSDCYYQCMLELYDVDSGNVTSDCYYQCMLELYDVDSGNVTSDCYYQCMLELYDVDSGNVTSDCYYQCMLELYDVDSGNVTSDCYYQCMLELYDVDSGNVTSDCYYQCMLELYDVDSGNVTSDCYYQCMLELYDVDSGNVTSDCYYQCMLELYDIDSGNVTSDCYCNITATPTLTPVPSSSTLDPSCFSPSGENCSWYGNCLEKQFNCIQGANDYGIAYAEMFCSLFQERYFYFSPQGQVWIDAVRKCLQVELVPLLRTFQTATCTDVRIRALTSQARCYLQPYINTTSICSLSIFDRWLVFWTIRNSIQLDFMESLFGYIEVSRACRIAAILRFDETMRNLRFGLQLTRLLTESWPQQPFFRRRREAGLMTVAEEGRSVQRSSWRKTLDLFYSDVVNRTERHTSQPWEGENSTRLHFHRLAWQAAQSLSKQLGWEDLGVTWFAYGKQADGDVLTVDVLLADKGAYHLNKSHPSSTPLNMTAVVASAAQAVTDGRVVVTLDGQRVQMLHFEGCGDMDCQRVYLNATAPPMTSVAAHPVNGWVLASLAFYFCSAQLFS